MPAAARGGRRRGPVPVPWRNCPAALTLSSSCLKTSGCRSAVRSAASSTKLREGAGRERGGWGRGVRFRGGGRGIVASGEQGRNRPPAAAGAGGREPPVPQGTAAHPSPTMPNTESIRAVLGPGRLPRCSRLLPARAGVAEPHLPLLHDGARVTTQRQACTCPHQRRARLQHVLVSIADRPAICRPCLGCRVGLRADWGRAPSGRVGSQR